MSEKIEIDSAGMARENSLYPDTVTHVVQVDDESILLAMTVFSNQLLVIISSHGKLGHLLQVSKECGLDQSPGSSEDVFTVESLLGADIEPVAVVGRYISERILNKLSRHNLLLGLSLKNLSKPFVKQLTEKILDTIAPEK